LALSLPHHSVTATWHDDSLIRDKFLFFKKKIKKTNQKENQKIQKIEELTRGTPFNFVNPDLIERANLRRFNKRGDQI